MMNLKTLIKLIIFHGENMKRWNTDRLHWVDTQFSSFLGWTAQLNWTYYIILRIILIYAVMSDVQQNTGCGKCSMVCQFCANSIAIGIHRSNRQSIETISLSQSLALAIHSSDRIEMQEEKSTRIIKYDRRFYAGQPFCSVILCFIISYIYYIYIQYCIILHNNAEEAEPD